MFRSAGAGHTIQGKYRVYGEGSVDHSGHPCEHGLDLNDHPLIMRTDYDSIWQYLRTEFAEWCFRRSMRLNAERGLFSRRRELPRNYWDRLAEFARARPFPPRTAEAALHPKDSIYGRGYNWFVVLHLHAILDLGDHLLTPAEWNTLQDWSEQLPADTVIEAGASVAGSPIPATWLSI